MTPRVNAYAEMLIERSEAHRRAREQTTAEKAPPPPPPPPDDFTAENLLRILNE